MWWNETLEYINRTNSCVHRPLVFTSPASILCNLFVHWCEKCDQCTSDEFSGSYFESSVVANRLPLTHPISRFLTGVATASNFKFCSGNLIAGVPAAGAAVLQSRTRTAVANCHSRQWSWFLLLCTVHYDETHWFIRRKVTKNVLLWEIITRSAVSEVFFYNAEKANCCCTHQHCQWLVLLPTADKESFVDQGMWCTETLITVNRFQIFDLDPRRPRPPKAGRAVHVVSEHVFAVSFVYLCITAL